MKNIINTVNDALNAKGKITAGETIEAVLIHPHYTHNAINTIPYLNKNL